MFTPRPMNSFASLLHSFTASLHSSNCGHFATGGCARGCYTTPEPCNSLLRHPNRQRKTIICHNNGAICMFTPFISIFLSCCLINSPLIWLRLCMIVSKSRKAANFAGNYSNVMNTATKYRWDNKEVLIHYVFDSCMFWTAHTYMQWMNVHRCSMTCGNTEQWIIALHHWPFVKGIHRWPVDSHHKRQVMREALLYKVSQASVTFGWDYYMYSFCRRFWPCASVASLFQWCTFNRRTIYTLRSI